MKMSRIISGMALIVGGYVSHPPVAGLIKEIRGPQTLTEARQAIVATVRDSTSLSGAVKKFTTEERDAHSTLNRLLGRMRTEANANGEFPSKQVIKEQVEGLGYVSPTDYNRRVLNEDMQTMREIFFKQLGYYPSPEAEALRNQLSKSDGNYEATHQAMLDVISYLEKQPNHTPIKSVLAVQDLDLRKAGTMIGDMEIIAEKKSDAQSRLNNIIAKLKKLRARESELSK